MADSTEQMSGTASEPAGVVRQFLQDLLARQRRLGEGAPAASRAALGGRARLVELMLGEALLRLVDFPQREPAPPRQVVVLGPTQVGKSTVVNLLVGQPAAEVSPLAGFTVHAQGFWLWPRQANDGWLEGCFPDCRRVKPEELQREELAAYAFDIVEPPFALSPGPVSDGPTLPSAVLWDTPDFDSLSAEAYERSVVEAAALADVYLLVLSKEKYADLTVWRMLRLLAPLGRPILICLNKTAADAAEVIAPALRERLDELGQEAGVAELVCLPHDPGLGSRQALQENAARADVAALVDAVGAKLTAPRPPRKPGVARLLRQCWVEWTAPLRAEHAALREWQGLVDIALVKFLERYERDYLEHPHRYDAFRRASIELLHLLEIPRFSRWISSARQVTTWPVRQLLALKNSWGAARHADDERVARLGAEGTVLFDALDEQLTNLRRETIRRADGGIGAGAVWRALERRLEAEQAALERQFHTALEAHNREVAAQIQASASRLYEALRRQPGRLTALRTARATLDVGGILLAVKTGGLSMMDAVWAPATFAFSSLLMESFAGAQMRAAAHALKNEQRGAVQRALLDAVLRPALLWLTDALEGDDLVGLGPQRLTDAEAALRAWEREQDE